ncbi:hypothetical protein [Streptomyces chartreusis]|uniref:hypothetical protein n=1 Tax=Streptomyces chartreusis TaxID=1969 RepID=UPI003649011C
MDPEDAKEEGRERAAALARLNSSLARDGYEAFYGDDGKCYLRHVATSTVVQPAHNPHRPLTAEEKKRRNKLESYLNSASEDELIENVLLPLFRQLGYEHVTAVGHRDKALEYGKDMWMRLRLPSGHFIYFGIQAKKDKLDASGYPKRGSANITEIINQARMALEHPVFDPDVNRQVLIDHVYIVAGGEITKQARALIVTSLDISQRRTLMFMDRVDILDLYTVTNLPVPGDEGAVEKDRSGGGWGRVGS